MRRALPVLPDAVTWPDTPDELVAFVRGDHLFVLNVADGPIGWEPGGTWQIVHRTGADRVPAATTEEAVLAAFEKCSPRVEVRSPPRRFFGRRESAAASLLPPQPQPRALQRHALK